MFRVIGMLRMSRMFRVSGFRVSGVLRMSRMFGVSGVLRMSRMFGVFRMLGMSRSTVWIGRRKPLDIFVIRNHNDFLLLY